MQLHERIYGDIVVVDIHGPVDRESGGTTQLVIALKRLVTRGYKTVLLNVAELVEIDSVLLGAIVQAHTMVSRSGASLKLVNVTDRLRALLATTKLDRFIETAESEDKELGG
jgi:anti-sigma B factor antagonist